MQMVIGDHCEDPQRVTPHRLRTTLKLFACIVSFAIEETPTELSCLSWEGYVKESMTILNPVTPLYCSHLKECDSLLESDAES